MQWKQVVASLYLIIIFRCASGLSKIDSTTDAMAEHEKRCSDMAYWDYEKKRKVHCFIACEKDSGLRSECIHFCPEYEKCEETVRILRNQSYQSQQSAMLSSKESQNTPGRHPVTVPFIITLISISLVLSLFTVGVGIVMYCKRRAKCSNSRPIKEKGEDEKMMSERGTSTSYMTQTPCQGQDKSCPINSDVPV